VKPEDIMVNYTPVRLSDWTSEVRPRSRPSVRRQKKTAVVSTITARQRAVLQGNWATRRSRRKTIPVVAFSVGEEELSGWMPTPLAEPWLPGIIS